MEIVKEIGAYAGLAAVPALAVLAALYFSQARDVKRLREWAGRAPERAAEPGPARVVAAPQTAVAKPAAQKPAAATPAAATQGAPAAAPAAAAAAAGAGPATVARPAAATPAAQKAAPAAAQGATAQKDAPAKPPASPGGVPPRPPGATPRTVTGRPGQTAIIPPAAAPQKQQPWYRRMFPSPRYLALALAGVLIIGGGAAFGLQQFATDEAPTPKEKPAPEEPSKKETRAAAINPASVTVAVLNGTTVPGLAAQVGDKVEAAKFDLGTVANSSDQQRAESVVLYAPKAEREATVVGRKLRISQREPIDPQTQGLAGDASVVVIAGADQTR